MGFKSKNTLVKGVPTKVNSPSTSSKQKPKESKEISLKLTEKEIEFLLITIKNSLFKGEYVEICYNATLKLQEEYKKFIKDK